VRLLLKILTIFCLFCPLIAYSQTEKLRIEWVETEIPLSGQCGLKLTFSKDFRKGYQNFQSFSYPDIRDLIKDRTVFKKVKVEGGPDEYVIIQLYRPRKVGSYNLPPVHYQIQGETYSTPGTTLKVVSNMPAYDSPFEEPEISDNLNFTEEKPEAFLQFQTDKTKIYLEEQFTMELSFLISQQNKAEISFFDVQEQRAEIIKKIKPANCLLEEQYYPVEMIDKDTVSVNGKSYYRWVIYRATLYPTDTLDIRIPTISFQVITYKTARNGNASIERKEQARSYSYAGTTIKVKSLPPHPLRGQVSVGRFTSREEISNRNVLPGKNITYSFSITGSGSLTSITEPMVLQSQQLDIFYPTISSSEEWIKGKKYVTKTFVYHIIPKVSGQYPLGQHLKWVYFNTEKQQYDTLAPRIIIQVKSNSKDSTVVEEHSSFYDQIFKENNRLRSKEKDKTTNFLVNLIILFMLVFTAILIFRK